MTGRRNGSALRPGGPWQVPKPLLEAVSYAHDFQGLQPRLHSRLQPRMQPRIATTNVPRTRGCNSWLHSWSICGRFSLIRENRPRIDHECNHEVQPRLQPRIRGCIRGCSRGCIRGCIFPCKGNFLCKGKFVVATIENRDHK